MKQNITILGSTGSIGTNTLDVLSRHLDRYQVFALTASQQVELMLKQCRLCIGTIVSSVGNDHPKSYAQAA